MCEDLEGVDVEKYIINSHMAINMNIKIDIMSTLYFQDQMSSLVLIIIFYKLPMCQSVQCV